jgi:REP element-mobilizing transposase RayT
VLNSLRWFENRGSILLEAAIIMPDHVHFIATLNASSPSLPKVMQTFKGYTAKTINEVLNRKGPVWQRGYHDHAIRKEEDLSEVISYVLNNPVRAGIVEDYHDYPFCYCRWEV